MTYEELRKAMVDAMKSKEEARLGILRLLVGDIDATVKDNGVEPTREVVDAATKKLLKQTAETRDNSAKAGTDDERTARLSEQVNILEKMLPEQLSGEALATRVRELASELDVSGMKDMGKLMGALNGETGGNFDKGAVAGIVKELI